MSYAIYKLDEKINDADSLDPVVIQEVNSNFVSMASYLLPDSKFQFCLQSIDKKQIDILMKCDESLCQSALAKEHLSNSDRRLVLAAFVIAIWKYNPSTIYLLDGIDATFDSTNSKRMTEVLEELAKHAQVS